MARAFERSEVQAKEIEESDHSTQRISRAHQSNEKHFQKKRRSKSRSRKCYRCGENYPHKSACPAEGKACHKCMKIGHFESQRRSKKSEKVQTLSN